MITEILQCLDHSLAFMREQVVDISDDEMFLQIPGAPNHAGWTFGHTIYSLQMMTVELGNAPWLPDDWESFFGYGSVSGLEASGRFSKNNLIAALMDARDRLRGAVMATDESKLAEPLLDDGARAGLATMGHALLQIVVAHTAYHSGQLAAWRRAIGRPPVGVFV